MLQDYAEGSGSAAKEAEKSANNVQGSLNKLSNTFTSTVNNIVNSDTLKMGINFLNELLEVINKLTDGLGGLGTVAMTAMGVLTAKGRGLTNYVTFIIVYKSPSIRLYNNAI